MLVLARKPGQSLILEQPGTPPIIIKIMRVRGSEVGIAISAAENIKIWRDEIYEQINEQAERLKRG